jgi:hypothetical protein
VFNTSCAGLALYHNRVQNSADWANNINTSNCGYSSQGDTVTPNFNAMFVAPGSPSYDYHLKSGAFAVGKANKSEFTATDIDGVPRDSAPDAGVDELGGGTAPPPADTTAPTTTISSATSGSTTATTASFSFTGSDNATVAGSLAYECKLDSGAYAACPSPKAYTGVAVGSHTFSVRAKDAAGNVDASPATAAWTVTAPAVTGPVAAYGFNEASGTTAADASGNSLTATITGATHTTAGKSGRALSFNGTSNLVTVADNAKLDLTRGMTLEAWVRPSNATGSRSVIFKEQSSGPVYGMYANTSTNRPAGYVSVGGEQNIRSTTQLPVNVWHHLAVTYDGVALRLYVDGGQVAYRALAGSIAVSTGALRIGGNNVWGQRFAGLIDEVRVYNRALTSTQLKADMAKAI